MLRHFILLVFLICAVYAPGKKRKPEQNTDEQDAEHRPPKLTKPQVTKFEHLTKYCPHHKASDAEKKKYDDENKKFGEGVANHLAAVHKGGGKNGPSDGKAPPEPSVHDVMTRCCIEVDEVFKTAESKKDIQGHLDELWNNHKKEMGEGVKKAKNAKEEGKKPNSGEIHNAIANKARPPHLLVCDPVECENDSKCSTSKNAIKASEQKIKKGMEKVKKKFVPKKKSKKGGDADAE